MTSPAVTKKRRDSVPTKYVVHYNSWDGEVQSVGSSKNEHSRHPYVYTESADAGKIIDGTLNPNQFIVSFPSSDTTELVFMPKDNVLRLRSSELSLFQLPKKQQRNWDLRVHIYKQNNMMEVQINPESIQKLTSFTYRKQLEISKDSDLTLYVVQHNNPDHLIDVIELDPIELLTNGSLFFDIAHITKYTSYEDIGFITRRCFKNYYVEMFDSPMIVAQKSLTKFKYNVILKAEQNVLGHIEIVSTNKGLKAVAKVANNEFHNIGLFEEWLPLHVVGSTPDEYYGTLGVNLQQLQRDGNYVIETDIDIRGREIIHNKPKLVLTTRVKN